MKEQFEIWSVESFSDGSGRSFWFSVPTHKDAVEILDGRLGVMGRTCEWTPDKMSYSDYWIKPVKVSSKEWTKLKKDWTEFQALKKKQTSRELELVAMFTE